MIQQAALTIIALFGLVRTMESTMEELFDDLNTIDSEINILETKFSTQKELDKLKYYQKEWRIFNNNMNVFVNLKLNESYDNFHLLSGLPSRHKNLDIYSNKYVLFTKKNKILLTDFSGEKLLEEELEANAAIYCLYQDHVRRFPQIFILTEQNEIMFYSLKVNRTTSRNKLRFELVLRYQFNIMIHNSIDIFPESYIFSDRKFTNLIVRTSKGSSSLVIILSDSSGNLYRLNRMGKITAVFSMSGSTKVPYNVNDLKFTYPLVTVVGDYEISFLSMSFQNKTAVCSMENSKIVTNIFVRVKRKVVAFVTENNELAFISHSKGKCKVLYAEKLDKSIQLDEPKMTLVGNYLLFFPNKNSNSYMLYDTLRTLGQRKAQSKILENVQLSSINNASNTLFDSIRGNKDKFEFFHLKDGVHLKGIQMIFFKDKVEEISNFKVPLMFIGIGVAFVYQICFKDSPMRSGRTRKMKQRDLRKEKLQRISKQIRGLEETASSFKDNF